MDANTHLAVFPLDKSEETTTVFFSVKITDAGFCEIVFETTSSPEAERSEEF